MKLLRHLSFALAIAVALAHAPRAAAISSYYTNNCSSCHGTTVTTCNGCHAHGTHGDSSKSSINVAGTLNKASFAAGETVTVTVTGGYRNGWVRVVLFDQTGRELARSSCPGGMGGCSTSVYPVTLTAPAPSAAGTYGWMVAWYGNQFDSGGASTGSGTSSTIRAGFYTPDAGNPNHGYQTVALPTFTVAAAAAPKIAVSPTSLSFGNVTIGAPTTRTFTVSNTGTAPLTGTVARAAGTSAEYTAAPASFNVAAGGNQVVTVTYAPTDTTADAGAIAVASNDPAAASVSVAVSGTGVAATAPNIALAPTSLAFGSITVGGSAALPVQVQNTGTAPLSVTQIARCASPATSAEYTWSPAGPFTVAAGGSTTVTVTYAPTAAGADAGCLAFSSNDTAHAVVSLNLSGTGVAAAAPKIAVSPASLAFGNVTVGGSSPKTFTISNTGNAPLTGTVARASGTSAEYAVAPAAFTVAAGGSQTVTVTYAPTNVGSDAGGVVVASNDATTPSLQVALSGAGVSAPTPAIVLAPTSLAFGTVTLGGAGTLTAAIRNSGTATLNVTSIAPCAGTSAEFSSAPAAPLTVAPGQSATVTVTYRPVDAGPDTGCLAVASNDPASPTVNLGLSGTGAAQAVAGIALDPTSIDFGTVVAGTTASRTTTVRNTGNARLDVTIARCSGTPTTFAFSPAAPFSVDPGQTATVTATFSPTVAATSSGCLALASNDPAHPTVELALAGTGTPLPVPSADADIDIDDLEVPRWVSPGTRTITPRVELENVSGVEGTASVRLVGTVGGSQVYDQTLSVTLGAGREREVSFPAYTLGAGTRSGQILWTATVADQDPDVDQATATTWLGRARSDDDLDRDGDGDLDGGNPSDKLPPEAAAAAVDTGSGAGAGGCSSAGGGAGFAALTALGLAILRRRARVAA